MRVLAIDLGIQVCGYVFCDIKGSSSYLFRQGEIKPPARMLSAQKLSYIIDVLQAQVKECKPSCVILEKLYSHHRHPTTIGALAQVKGVIALFSYRWGLDIFEFSPTKARKSFMGKGNVDSERVKKMAENITGKTFCSQHTADAYSLVTAFAHAQKFNDVLNQSYTQ